MNFNQLRYIIAVDKHRNFSHAADECGVAQSTLSREIQRLEKEFRIMIFDRSKYPVVPTLKGRDLIDQAKQIIHEHDRFVEIARKRTNEPSGTFRLGIHPGIAPYLLPLFTEHLSKKYLRLNVRIIEASQKEMTELFEAEALDAGLTIAPFYKEGYYEDPLFEEEFVLYINQNHPLAKQQTVHWDDIPLDELLLHEDVKTLLSQSNHQHQVPLATHKIKNLSLESGSLETIRKMIDINGGMTLLPHLSTIYMGGRRLRMVRKIESPSLSRTIVMVTPRGFEKNRILKVVRAAILDGLPDLEKKGRSVNLCRIHQRDSRALLSLLRLMPQIAPKFGLHLRPSARSAGTSLSSPADVADQRGSSAIICEISRTFSLVSADTHHRSSLNSSAPINVTRQNHHLSRIKASPDRFLLYI